MEPEGQVTSHGGRRGGRKKRKKLIKCATINAQSLEHKMSALELKANKNEWGIISVTETWSKKEKP